MSLSALTQGSLPVAAPRVLNPLMATELNHAFDLMLQGEVKRSVIVYE